MAFVFLILATVIVVGWLSASSLRAVTVTARIANRLGAFTTVMALGVAMAFAFTGDKLLVGVVFIYAIGYGVFAWTSARALTGTAGGSPSPTFGNELHQADAAEHDAHRTFPHIM